MTKLETHDLNRGAFTRIAMTLGLSAAVCPLVALGLPESAMAASVTGTPLRLHNPHTQERYDIQLFQGRQWNRMGILSCDWMMRDWRENQTVQCDRKLYAALYVIQRKYEVTSPISVNSGFRSVKTNSMLRGRSIEKNGGASWETPAVNSQHCKARAVDFRVPGVEPRVVAAFVETLGMGGTGNYPTFTHMDTGSVRRWGPKP
ncbi:DUF882 domain-containing protein [Agrobacterium salinitolerans]|nr:DUF882 domain-containing protein [Agrobacterium salinitolerans]